MQMDAITRAYLLPTPATLDRVAYVQLEVLGLIEREHIKVPALFDEIVDGGRVEATRADVPAVLEAQFGAKPIRRPCSNLPEP